MSVIAALIRSQKNRADRENDVRFRGGEGGDDAYLLPFEKQGEKKKKTKVMPKIFADECLELTFKFR